MKTIYLSLFICCLWLFSGGSAWAQTAQEQDRKTEALMETHSAEYQAEVERLSHVNDGHSNLVGREAPPAYPRFISFPTSHQKPPFIASENHPEMAKQVHGWRMQHWYFIFDQATYQEKYGKLPTVLPFQMTPQEYAKNPPASAFSEDLERYIETGK